MMQILRKFPTDVRTIPFTEILIGPPLMSELEGKLIVIWPNSLGYRCSGRD